MRVVLDTNGIVSGILTGRGPMAAILRSWRQGAFELVVSEAILAKYASVLRYPRHRLKHESSDFQLAELDNAFREFSTIVIPDQMPNVVIDDPDDDHFLAAGVAGGADVIVSGDDHFLTIGSYRGISIQTLAAFVVTISP